MPKRTKPAGKFGGRPGHKSGPGKRVHLSLAVPQPLKDSLAKAALAKDWSVSNEAAYRLQGSLQYDTAIGADVRHMSLIMTAAFAAAGRRRAEEKGLGGEWAKDPDCYLAALTHTLHHLLLNLPRSTSPTLVKGSVESEVLTWLTNLKHKELDDAR